MNEKVPDGWKRVKLGEVVDIKHGFAFKGEGITYGETEAILLTPGNFNIGGGFKSEKQKYYKGQFPREYVLSEGSFIITMTDLSRNSDTLGYSAKIPFYKNKIFLHNQRIGLLDFIDNNVCKEFIYWLTRTPDYHCFIVNSASGTSIMHTSPSRIKNYEFYMPPFLEQKAITSVLSSLDDKIDLLHRQNNTLEQMAETLFRRWFVEEAKEEWGTSTIGEQLTTVLGGTPSTTKQEYWDGDVPWINSGEVNKFRIYKPTRYITKLGLENSNTKILPKGTIVIAITGATLGQISLLEIDTCTNQSVVGIIPNKNYPKEFVFFWIKHTIKEIILNETGGAQPHINKNDIYKTKLIVPPLSIIKEKVSILSDYFNIIINNNNQISALEKLRDILLPKLMSGEVRVRI